MHITPTIGRIVWYRGKDDKVRAAIVTYVWSEFCINLQAFGRDSSDAEAGIHTSVTHGDIAQEPGCFPSWSWMPYQIGQAKAQAVVVNTESLPPEGALRKLTTHQVNECNESIAIDVLDGPGPGGASHRYRLSITGKPWRQVIEFQNGPIAEVGTNGLTHEALLAIIIDRLQAFQAGPYACPENEDALAAVRRAMHCLWLRTQKREARGVEGTSTV